MTEPRGTAPIDNQANASDNAGGWESRSPYRDRAIVSLHELGWSDEDIRKAFTASLSRRDVSYFRMIIDRHYLAARKSNERAQVAAEDREALQRAVDANSISALSIHHYYSVSLPYGEYKHYWDTPMTGGRIAEALKFNGVQTIGDFWGFCARPDKELLRVKGIGKVALSEIREIETDTRANEADFLRGAAQFLDQNR